MFCRLVNEGHIPYLNAYEQLPEEMKVTGKDSLIFVVEVRKPPSCLLPGPGNDA